MKYLAVLALAICAFAGESKAQATVQFQGGGSSALFLELGQAAIVLEGGSGTACSWTLGKNANVLARDSRVAPSIDEQGNVWVVWGPGTGTCAAPTGAYDVYSYMQLDSVVGDKCYFEVDASGIPGCVQVMNPGGTTNANLLCYPSTTTCTQFGDTVTTLPAAVATALNGQHFFVAGTDIRPEDAKFATYRMLTPCGQAIYRQPFDQGLRQTYGLGYQSGTTGVGGDVHSSFSTAVFHVLDFNLTGNDPINTSKAVPAYTVSTVGAQPIVVAVSPAGGTGIGAATDINTFTLTLFYQGVLGRNTDLLGPTVLAPVTTLVREPLSGTYNTFEYSVPNSSQFHTSQDEANCSGNVAFADPMTLQSANGQTIAGGAAFRKRVIGTGEMVAQIKAASTADQRLGYFFWSAGNGGGFTTGNGKYLTVNGVDPLKDTYTDGVFPGTDVGHPLSDVTFKWLNQGDYPIWSALRLVSKSPTPAGVTNVIAAAQTLNSSQRDFITLPNLKIWHSHYYMPAINSVVSANGKTINSANDLCNAPGALVEFGGDAGGATVLKVNNANFCTDFANQNGLINKAN